MTNQPGNDRGKFLRAIYGQSTGYMRVARMDRHREKTMFVHTMIHWPTDQVDLDSFISIGLKLRCDIYFCPHLFATDQPHKEQALPGHVLWADLDTCQPTSLEKYGEPFPTYLVESSSGRWQAYWVLDSDIIPSAYQELNRRIAYAYKDQGCDKSGWDLTQLLRMPETVNYKRPQPWDIRLFDGGGRLLISRGRQFDRTLPVLPTRTADPGDGLTDSLSYLRSLTNMNPVEKYTWNYMPPPGSRSEHIFILIRLLRVNLGFGDGLIIKTLMEHPLLIDKWPHEHLRMVDIRRCLLKIKRGEV